VKKENPMKKRIPFFESISETAIERKREMTLPDKSDYTRPTVKIRYSDSWSHYFRVYDKGLLPLRPYQELIYVEIPDQIMRARGDQINEAEKVSLLDLGTGTGNVILGLKKRLPAGKLSYVGIDATKEALDVARDKFSDNESVQFFQGNIFLEAFGLTGENWRKIKGKKFDIITMNNVLYCLNTIEKTELLTRLKAYLSDTGILVISDPHQEASLLQQLKIAKGHIFGMGFSRIFQNLGTFLANSKNLKEISKFNRGLTSAKNNAFLPLKELQLLLESVGYTLEIEPNERSYAGIGYICTYSINQHM
jgi:SAM-dependent methyltransferase